MKYAIYNAKVYVNKGEFAEAVLVEEGLIKKVGTTEEILAVAGDAEKIDAEGRTVVPGFNDSHMHILQFGETLYQANIEGVKSIDEMIDRCKKFMEEHPERMDKICKTLEELMPTLEEFNYTINIVY